MDKRIEKSIDDNANLSEEFKTMVKTCFGRIFDMLGKRNFERWIDKRDLADRIKDLVIESMSTAEEEKHPEWGGFYTRGTNKIKIRTYKDLRTTEDTATHEKFHFITDKGINFPTFIDEGLTEYMKGMVEGRANSYTENVATVEFLHQIFGDSLIKAYLIGKPHEFNKKFASLLVGEDSTKQKEGLAEVDRFYAHLQKFHDLSSARSRCLSACNENNRGRYTDEEIKKLFEQIDTAEKSFETVKDDLIGIFQKIVIAKISKMAKDLEFYRNGILDLEYASQTITELLKYFPGYQFDKDFLKMEALKEETFKLAAREVIQNSHLVAYDEGEKREQKIATFVEKISPRVERRRRQITKVPTNFKNDDPILVAEDDNTISKLLHILVTKPEISTMQYLERLAIVQDKFGIPDDTMEYILLKHNYDRFGKSPILGELNSTLLKVFPMFRRLSLLERKRDEDTIASSYSELDFNRFVEKRDNQKFFIEFDENGEINEQELCFGNNIVFSGRKRLEINYRNGIRHVEIRDSSGKIGPIHAPISLAQLKELKFVEAITEKISEKIAKGTYISVLEDDPNPFIIDGVAYTNEVDTRTREINWDDFIQDFKNINPVNTQDFYVRARFQMELTDRLLDSAYGFYPRRNERGMLVRDDDIDEIYGDISIEIDRILGMDLSEKQFQIAKEKIIGLSSKLNEARKVRVAESSKTALLHFETPEAKKEYFELLAKENQERADKAVREFDYGEYVEIAASMENSQFQLFGVYTTSDIDTRDRKLLLEKFAEATKTLMKKIPEEQRKDTYDAVFSRMIQRAYGIGKRDLQNDKQLQSNFDIVRTAVSNNVFEGKKLDDKPLIEALDSMNTYHKQTAENNKKVAAIAFKDEGTKRMYDVIVALTRENLSFDDMQKQVRTLIEIHNDSKKGPSSKNENEQNYSEDK